MREELGLDIGVLSDFGKLIDSIYKHDVRKQWKRDPYSNGCNVIIQTLSPSRIQVVRLRFDELIAAPFARLIRNFVHGHS